MPPAPIVAFALAASAVACSVDDDGGSRTVELGECAPPAGALDVAIAPLSLGFDHCLAPLSGDLAVVASAAEWDGRFSCPTPVPDGLDLSRARAALVQVDCTPTEVRFAAETSTEVVLGIYTRVSGACLDAPVVVALPRSSKPVRLARCQESCEGDCPPVP
jgi:hypothetical protein